MSASRIRGAAPIVIVQRSKTLRPVAPTRCAPVTGTSEFCRARIVPGTPCERSDVVNPGSAPPGRLPALSAAGGFRAALPFVAGQADRGEVVGVGPRAALCDGDDVVDLDRRATAPEALGVVVVHDDAGPEPQSPTMPLCTPRAAVCPQDGCGPRHLTPSSLARLDNPAGAVSAVPWLHRSRHSVAASERTTGATDEGPGEGDFRSAAQPSLGPTRLAAHTKSQNADPPFPTTNPAENQGRRTA